MPKNTLPVITAIPNYNMADSLSELLSQVLTQGYDAVFVLDDASSDNSRQVVEGFGDQITFVGGAENVGAGANRNRIIPVLKERGMTALIHFIDADMRPTSSHVAETVRAAMADDRVGFVVGLVTDEYGRQLPWNYGPRQCLQSDLAASLQTMICAIGTRHPKSAKRLRALFGGLLRDWPDPLSVPQRRRVFWGSEANLVIRSDIFADFGGFDPELREHEIQDLAIRMHDQGLERRFDPRLSAVHTAVEVRSGNRYWQMTKMELKIARKYGLRNWLLPDGKFHPEL